MSTHDLIPREGEEQVRELLGEKEKVVGIIRQTSSERHLVAQEYHHEAWACLLYTSDAADELMRV